MLTPGQVLCIDAESCLADTWDSVGLRQCYVFPVCLTGLFSSLNITGAAISSADCFVYTDVLGRRREVQIGTARYFTGALLTALAPTLWCVFLGFTTYGLGVSFAMHATPVYVAEIAPPEVRGMLASATELVIVVGMLSGSFCGWACLSLLVFGWRVMIGVAGILNLCMSLGIRFCPQIAKVAPVQRLLRGRRR